MDLNYKEISNLNERNYKKLLKKLENTPCVEIRNSRIRISNYTKGLLFANSFVTYKLKLV